MRFCDGFEYGLAGVITATWSGAIAIVSTSGNRHVDFAGNGSTYGAIASGGTATTHVFGVGDRWIHIAAKSTGDPSFFTFVGVLRSGTQATNIQWQGSTGTLRIQRGDGTTVATSSAAVAVANAWHWFWIDMDTRNSAGTVAVYVDGNTTAAVSFTGDTTSGATDGFDQMNTTCISTNSIIIDDWVTYTDAEKAVFASGTYPELFIAAVVPTSDSVTGWSAGTFASIDETPWDSADYVETVTSLTEYMAGATGLSWSPSAVRGVCLSGYLARDGTIDQFGPLLKSSTSKVTTKQKCRLATTTALAACTAAGTGAGKTLTANANGALTVDSVAVVAGNSVLVKNQATTQDNGPYLVTVAGTAGTPFVLTRRSDWDGTDPEVNYGDLFQITEGTTNTDTYWMCTTADTITIDTTAITFTSSGYIAPTKTGASAGTFALAQACYPTDPNGGIPWTYAAVQAATFGFQAQTAI